MKTNKTTETKVGKSIPDNINASKGTEYGQHFAGTSLRQFGAGRSTLLDKNNRIITRNKTVENTAAVGLENVIVVETTGDQIVAVKGTDVDLDLKFGRELAIAGNASTKVNIEWDEENVQQITKEWEVDPVGWGIPELEIQLDEEEEPEEEKRVIDTRLIVECGDVAKLSMLFSELQDRDFKCELEEQNNDKI